MFVNEDCVESRSDVDVQLKSRYCHRVSQFTVTLLITCIVALAAEEIDFEIGHFHKFWTLTLTLDRVMWHTIVYHSSASIYTPNFVYKGQTFCGRTDVRTLRP